MKIAAIYARKSKITEKGDSIDNQIRLCKNYLSALGILNVLIYSDEGFSGKDTDRPEFKRLIQDAKNKSFDLIICYKLDRISRNVSDFSTLISRLDKLKISFISVVEQFDTTTAMGKAMMYITSVFSQLERETISQRIMDNMYSLAEKGYWLGGEPPTGYTNQRVSRSSNGREHTYAILKPIEEEVELIKLIFSKYLSLGSLSQVEKYMLSKNIKTKRNKYWSKAAIKTVIENPCYVKSTLEVIKFLNSKGISTYGEADGLHGFLIYKKRRGKNGSINDISEWIYAISEHEGIIESEDWIKAQELSLKNKKKMPAAGSSNVALLSGLIRCKQCGSFMRVAYGEKNKTSGKKNYYYMCSLKHNSGKTRCSSKNVNGKDLDEVIIGKVNELSINKKIFISELNKYSSEIQEQTESTSIYKISNKIDKNNTSIANLINNIGLTTEEDMVKLLFIKIEELKSENLKLNNEIESFNKGLKQQEKIIANNINFIKNLKDVSTIIYDEDIKEQKRLIGSIIEKVYVDGDNGSVRIKFKTNNMI